MSESVGQAPGFFGKLPSLGDFVTRRLPGAFVQPWDLWLSESLAESQARLGETWLDVYLTSPLWRFVLTPGLIGREAWAGVLMPSVDRVGRYFPFTLCCQVGVGLDPIRLLVESDWFERAEGLVLSGLAEDGSLDKLDAEARALGCPATPARAGAGRCAGLSGGPHAWRLAADSPLALMALCPSLLGAALEQVFSAYSLWWSSGSQRVEPSFLLCQGLPPQEGFHALLGGGWAGAGWVEPLVEPPAAGDSAPGGAA